MTMQIRDTCKHNNKRFSIVEMSAPMAFNPKDYGLEPQLRCTACYRGYWCEYNICDDELYLQNFYMFNLDNNYPPLNGANVSEQKFEKAKKYTSKGVETALIEENMGHRVYENVNLNIPYTGRILVGDEYIRNYSIFMEYRLCWAYKILQEFVFEDGLLLETIDHSKYVEELRIKIKELGIKPAHLDDAHEFVTNSFSLDYVDKAWWWIKER